MDRPRQAKYRCSVKGRFTEARAEARRRNVEWQLTLIEFTALLAVTQCHYCRGTDLPRTKSGLDRKDFMLPYSITNVVPCCTVCNVRKNKTHHDLFCEQCVSTRRETAYEL